jgi:hypothetical protein
MSSSPKPVVCKYYLRRECKYGRKGDDCRFSHPKLCPKFTKFGGRRKDGCNKGKECKLHHPALCWKAVDGLVCSHKKCKFFHPTGIKAVEKTKDAIERTKEKEAVPHGTTNVSKGPTCAEVTRGGSPTKPVARPDSETDNTNSFLE